MFGKVKQWLGIEGVKVELVLPEKISAAGGLIEGKLRFQTMNTQKVKKIKLVLTEKYSRGRFKNKLIDQYKIAEIEQAEDIIVPADEPIEIDFSLPFNIVKSDMDELGDKNIVFRKIVNAAKLAKNVKSEYFLEAEAEIEGTALNPFDKQIINIV
ncbi:MAG: sporulation protein [Bacteroidota bacterium]|nr:sporulation protein [Bacteroidota bacterium]